MNRLLFAVLVVLVLILFFVVASRFQTKSDTSLSGTDASEALTLRSYTVDNVTAKQLQRVLSDLFLLRSGGTNPNRVIGQATVAPSGELLVLAPESVHEGVKSLVSHRPPPSLAPAPNIRMTYWMVLGSPSEGQKPNEIVDIAGALAVVEKRDGLGRFTVLEKAELQSVSGESGALVGREFKLFQNLSFNGKTIDGSVDLNAIGLSNSARMNVSLMPNQTVVLANSSAASKESGDAAKHVYFLARPTLDAAAQP